jgi:hypothetical protein
MDLFVAANKNSTRNVLIKPAAIKGLSRNWRISIFMQKSLLFIENVMVIPSKQYLPGCYFSDN